jgi:hypothetical protein
MTLLGLVELSQTPKRAVRGSVLSTSWLRLPDLGEADRGKQCGGENGSKQTDFDIAVQSPLELGIS